MPHLASPPCYTESAGVVMLPADNGLPLAAPALPLLTLHKTPLGVAS